MGTLLDTTVFIDLERAIRRLPPASAMAEVSGRLEQQLGPDEEVNRRDYGVGVVAWRAPRRRGAPGPP